MTQAHDRTAEALLPPAETLKKRSARPMTGRHLALILALCAAFACACGALAGAFFPGEGPEEEARAASAFTQLIPDGAGVPTSVSIARGAQAFTLSGRDGVYAVEGMQAQISAQAAQRVLESGASVLARQRVAGERAQFGLDEGALRAVFGYADGTRVALTVGDELAAGEGRYAAVDGDAGVYVVNASLYDALNVDANDLLALPDFSQTYTAQTLMAVTLTPEAGEPITIRRVVRANPFNTVAEFVSPIRYPANSERTAELFLALGQLQPRGVRSRSGPEEMYGLDKPLATIALTGPQDTLNLRIGRSDEGISMRIEGDPYIYALSEEDVAFLSSVSVAWLAEQLPGLVALNQVERLELIRGGETWTLGLERADDGNRYALNGEPLAEQAALQLYQAAISLLIDRYAPAETAGEPRAAFRYTLTDGTQWELAFYAEDGEYDRVLRDGDASFLMARGKVERVFELAQSLQSAQGESDGRDAAPR